MHSPTPRPILLLSLAGTSLWIAAYMWLWRDRLAGHELLFWPVLFVIVFLVHRARPERWTELVGSRVTLGPAVRRIAIVVLPPGALVLAAALAVPPPLPGPARLTESIAGALAFGTAQQYVLLVHLFRSAHDLTGSAMRAAAVAAGIFALLHWPNPFLMPVTLAAGLAACWVYHRSPHVLAIGVGHGMLSCAMYFGLPRSVTFGLKVGPGFYD